MGSATVDVTGVSLDKTTAQTIEVNGKVSFTTTVEPDNATDNTVKWSVDGTNASAVTLYTDENCTTEVGTDATETLTVYAKGISEGEATVTATSNADSTKSASCDVTVNAAAADGPSVAISPTGGGSVEVTSVVIEGNDWYRFTATPATGYRFSKWTCKRNGSNYEEFQNTTHWSKSSIDSGSVTDLTAVFEAVSATVPVTGVTLDKTSTTVTEGSAVKLTATVLPDGATNKKVKWNAYGGGVALYSDEQCSQPVALNTETDVREVYIKGVTASTIPNQIIVKSVDNEDKKAQCTVTVNAAHTHSFTYSADGVTITASCSADGCDLTNKQATLTLAAEGGTYDGTTAYSATVTNNIPAVTSDTVGSVAYYKVDTQGATTGGTAQTGAPTGAGFYYASVTLTSGSNSYTAVKAFTVAKADPSATAPTATATYGQTLADVTLTNPDGNTAGTWAWADATTTSVGTVGDHTFKSNFTPTDTTNYNSKSNVDVTVTVGKAANPATVTSTASVTKGGSAVDLASNVTKNGATGAVSYEISGEAKGCTLDGSVLTSGNDAGSVTVNVTVAADGNYNASAAMPITVTINDKQTQTITASDVTAAYGDTDKSVSATTDGDGAISYAVKSGDAVTVNETTGALTIVKAGSAVITVTAAETATYAQATKDVNVTVNTISMTVTAADVNVTVDGQPHGITVNVTDPVSGSTVKYGTEEGSYTLDASPTQTEVGEKTVYYQVTADNYTTYTGSTKVTVSAKQAQTIAAENVTANYGDTDKKVSATTNGNGTISYAVKDGSGDYIAVDASTGALTIKKVPEDGKAYIVVAAAETSTYTQATTEVTVTINKANAVAATVTANNRTYDGTEKPLVTVSGTPTGGEMRYALGENATTAPAYNLYTTSIPTATDAGT